MGKVLFWLFLVFSLNLHANFTVPKSLEPSVVFWRNVYSLWDTDQVIFHDNQNLNIIYYIMNLPKAPGQLSSQKYSKEVAKKRKEIEKILSDIYDKNKIEKKSNLYEEIESILEKNNLLQEDLKDRLRTQSGLKSQFAVGLKMSGRYIEEMKALLKAQGLPDDLVAIPFVESLFSMNALSHKGASGPWGIMPQTGHSLGIHINGFIDERNDPLLATFAASVYLKKAYENIKDWGASILSYNYGYPGTMRAINNLGTNDVEVIIAKHESPIFGFACKNYLAEFLAALEIIQNIPKFFPDIELEKPWEYEFVELSRPVHVGDLESFKVISKQTLKELNPALTKNTLGGKEAIPPKYALRIPKGYTDIFYEQIKKIPDHKRKKAGELVSKKYKTNGKETIYKIAEKNSFYADFLAEKMGKDLNYKPKGIIVLKSAGNKFLNVLQIAKDYINVP